MSSGDAGPDYVFFGGKGGVGKTTCAAAAALAASRAGRVLIVSTDPAHSLGDALQMELRGDPTRVRLAGARIGARLEAVELDAGRALRRWTRQHARKLQTIAEHGTYLDAEDIERLLKLSLPGVDEMIGLVELRRLALTASYSTVIVDTAPTGHTLRLLAMPETLRRIASIFDDMQAKHRFLAQSLGGRYRADAGDELIEEIDDEARTLIETLRDPGRTRFSWVLLPEMLALEETKDGIAALKNEGIAVMDIIVNRVTTPSRQPCAVCDRRIESEATAISALQARFPRVNIRYVPELPDEPRGVAQLKRLAYKSNPPAPARRKRRAPSSPSAKAKSDWLDFVAPRGCRLLMFGGKGGVGKTTCAAAAALRLAGSNRAQRILLLSTDPAHSLGDVLQAPLDNQSRAVAGVAHLEAREIDAQCLFDERRERYREDIDELFDALKGGSSFDVAYDRAVVRDLIDLSPAGLDEIFGILSVSEALVPQKGRPSRYDLVVLDMAPTGHALRLLEMPQTALDWVHALLAILLKYRKAGTVGSLAADLLETARQMRELLALLRDPRRTRLVAVTRAAELPRLETARMLRKVGQLKIAVSTVLVNAAMAPDGTCARCRRVAAVEGKRIAKLPGPRTQVIAPLEMPPPRGVTGLLHWSDGWKQIAK